MASTFFGLNIGKTGLYTYQSALNTTAHNASNTETVGYTRQVLNLSASKPLSVGASYGMVGTGVQATDITQIRNHYYDTKYRSNNAIAGMYSTKETYMLEVENYFNEIEKDGFITSLSNLGESLQELSKDATSLPVRTQIAQYATSMTEYINSLASNLRKVQEDANTELKTSCDRINALAQEIAMLTNQINTSEVNGITANDLRDARNVLVDELSSFANISVTENVVGNNVGKTTYIIKLDGKTLVDTTEYNTINAIPSKDKNNVSDMNGLYQLVWSDGQEFNNTSPTLGGTLQALYQVRDGNNGSYFTGTVAEQDGSTLTITSEAWNNELLLNIPESGKITIGLNEVEYESFSFEVDEATGEYTYTFTLAKESASLDLEGQDCKIGTPVNYKGVPYYMNQLNEFVRTFAKEMNGIHSAGQNLNGTSGLDFFSGTNPVTGEQYSFSGEGASSYYQMNAFNFSVNEKITEDPNNIATTLNIADGKEGIDVLTKMINALGDKTMFNQGSPETFFTSLIADIAIDSKKVQSFAESQTNILTAIENQRYSISGVDIDEEAMNLIRYQNAYNLSAKIISIMDEIYDTLIRSMGV